MKRHVKIIDSIDEREKIAEEYYSKHYLNCKAQIFTGLFYIVDTMVGVCKHCGCPVDDKGIAICGCEYGEESCKYCKEQKCQHNC